jgi:transposase
MLYEAAQSMLRSKKWSWLKAWAMQVRRCGMKKAIVALARRALRELPGLPKIIT